MTSPLVEEVHLPPEQRRALERLLGRMVVEPRVIWLPLGHRPVTSSRCNLVGPSNAELERWIRMPPSPLGDFGEAWTRLEAQAGIFAQNRAYREGAAYVAHMLDWLPSRQSLLWEGPRGASRAWAKSRGGLMLPLPLGGAVEGILDAWWGLSGGLFNHRDSLLPLPDVTPELYPHYQPGDEAILRSHPSAVPYEAPAWLSPLEGAVIDQGVQYIGGEPVRGTPGPPLDTDWVKHPALPWGLYWLEEQAGLIDETLLIEARGYRELAAKGKAF